MAENPRFGRENSPSRILQIALVSACKLRDMAVSRWSPSYLYHQRQLATAILQEVLPSLSPPANLPPPTTWTVRHVVRTVTDRGVVMLGPVGQPVIAVLKMAHTPQAILSLQRNNAALKLLHADERLGSWRTLIPTLLAEGVVHGYHYAIEQAMPGCNAQGLLNDSVLGPRLQLSAAKAINQIHEATSSVITVGEEIFERWVGVHLRVLRYWNESLPSAMRNRPAIETLASQLRQSLFGLSLSASWIHGDFWCANLLVTPDGSAITGFLDWDLAAADDLPQLDQVQLLISTRKILRGREIGSIMVELLKGGSWLPYEQAILDGAKLPGDTVDLRTLLLLTWLRDVATNLTESARYPDKWYW